MSLSLGQSWLTEQHGYPTRLRGVFQGFCQVRRCKFLNLFGVTTPSGLVVDRHRGHRDGVVRQVPVVARGADDLVDDVHPLGHLPEQRVLLGELAGQVLVADEELAAVGVRTRVGHREGAADVVALDRLVLELVARSAGPEPPLVEAGLLAVLAVAGLGHEARDDAVEDDVVIEALLRERDEVGRGLGRALVVELDLDVAQVGRDGGCRHGPLSSVARMTQGLAIVTVVIFTAGLGSSTPFEAAKIASATSIPDVTWPMIWYVL